MRIAELFHSIQGEGKLTGIPSVFIRTSGCNLRCRWCDTKYASWNPEGEDIPIPRIVEQALAFGSCRHVVITGGEPMIAKGIHDLCAALHRENFHITIETAATVAPDGIACDLASLSPKLENSIPLPGEIDQPWIDKHRELRLQPAVIREWLSNYEYQLKFVISGSDDFEDLQRLLDSIRIPIEKKSILLMPEGTTPAELQARKTTLVDLCKAHGYRYCHRLHIDLFGNTRAT